MAKKKPGWLSRVPVDVGRLSLDELRNFKEVDTFLTGPISGPPGFAYHVRGFRYLLFVALDFISEDKFPPLTRCWKDLEKRFMGNPAFDDDMFVKRALIDFPFGPKDETALDYFEQFLEGTPGGDQFKCFITEARKSRLGLYQDVMRSKKESKFCELFTGTVVSAFRSVNEYERGEIS